MRTFVAVALLIVGSGCTQPDAFIAPVIFVGTLESETLMPRHASDKCQGGSDGSAEEWTCVSNSCGVGQALFRIDRLLLGTHSASRGVVRYGLGEWCEPEFFPARTPSLVCVSSVEDGEHRFRAEPIYGTVDGDVILPFAAPYLGNLELEPLFRPLPEAIPYAALGEVDAEHLKILTASGRVTSDGGTVFAVQGVFLDDLARSIGTGQWQPRTFTIVPDGLGGYEELPQGSSDDGDASTGAPTEQGRRRLIEC